MRAALRNALVASVPVVLLGLAACGSPVVFRDPRITVTGRVTYERRVYDPVLGALSATPVVRPVRGWPVLVSKNGVSSDRTVTDSDGYYSLRCQPGDTVTITCVAGRGPSDRGDGVDFQVYDPGADEYSSADDLAHNVSRVVTVTKDVRVDLNAPLTGNGGAFAICDTLNSSFEMLNRYGLVSATRPFPFHLRVFWRRGMMQFRGTGYTSFTYPAENYLFVRSFEPGLEATTRADEWNENTVTATFAFFIVKNYSYMNFCEGIADDFDVDPRAAWDSGFAAFWSLICLNRSDYRSCAGYGPTGSIAYYYNAEAGAFPAHPEAPLAKYSGVFSECAVTSLLLDLHDGPGTQPADLDGDPVVGLDSEIFAIFTNPTGLPSRHYVTVADFLSFWESWYPASFPSVTALSSVEHIWWPLPASDVVPKPIAATQSGFCDSTAFVAGTVCGMNYDIYDLYLIEVTTPGTIDLTLTISGTGSTPEDLDLHLHREAVLPVAASETILPVETISYAASPGFYLVEVRAYCDFANAAAYTLTYSFN